MASADCLTRGALDRSSVTPQDVIKCLQDSAEPFLKLEKLFYQMVAEASAQNEKCKRIKLMMKRSGDHPALEL